MRWIGSILLAVVLAGGTVDFVSSVFLDGAVAGVAMAAEEAEEAQGGGRDLLVSLGGVIGLVIILVSIAALALIIQYTVEQKREKLIPPHVVAELEQLFEEQSFDEAAEMCQAEDTFITRIVGAGLSKMEGGFDAVAKGVEIAGDEETTKLLQRLSNVSMLAGIAPMLGLFGTVQGMIQAFNVIATTAGGASPAQLADGISIALITTFEGLLVAIPSLMAYHFLKNRAINISMEAGTIMSDLFERLRQPQA